MSDTGDSNDRWFPLVELAGRIGGLIWVEQQLFELLGAWATDETDVASKLLFAETGRHHGWHAQLLTEALPTSPELLDRSLISAPSDGWVSAPSQLRRLQGAGVRIRALERVLNPWVDREIAALQDLAVPSSDRPSTRLLNIVGFDHRRDQSECERVTEKRNSDVVDLDMQRLLASIDLG